MIRRLLLLALTLSLLVACGRGGAGAPNESPDSGVTGTVLLGPTCPVEREAKQCPDEPIEAEIRVLQDGDLVTTVESGADGRFSVALAPGQYVLEPVDQDPGVPPFAKPVSVTVRAHEFTQADVLVDTGIR